MKTKLTKLFCLLFLFFPIANLHSQVPDGGNMLNATSGTTYWKVGPGILTQVSVEGQSFDKALRFEIAENFSNTWGQQIQFPAAAGIEKDDIILVAFYARTVDSQDETGAGYLNVILENNSTYVKEINHAVTIGREWTEYYASAKSSVDLTKSQISYTFHCGFPNQTIEVADVRYLNYKNTLTLDDLPVTKITYSGREPDANWRIPAAERIHQNRKGPLNVVVYDESGSPVEGATVSIEMTGHEFKFGSAVALSAYNNNPVYKSKIFELFNEIVWENDLKWPSLDPKFNNDALKNALIELADSGITVRGHNIIWPSWTYLPSSLEDYKSDPVALRREISSRIEYATTFTKGYVIDWDVINEPYTNHDIMDILGYESMAEWFKRMKLYDKDVKLYMNDYSIISASGTDFKHQDNYFETIQTIMQQGGPVDGIGIQGHIGGSLTPITKIYEIIDRFASLGLEIKITENDIDLNQRDVQAEYLRDFMTILFSHPSVKGILSWGFWEGQHYTPDGAYFNRDWTIRPHGQMFIDLVYNDWWTQKTDSVSNQNGETTFEGYLGEYKYTISHEGKERSGSFTLKNSYQSAIENKLILSFDEDVPDNIKIKHGTLVLCEGENTVLEVPYNAELNYTWYKESEVLADINSNISVSEAGLYSVKLSKGSIEIYSDTVKVIVSNLPSPLQLDAPDNLLLCDGDIYNLTIKETTDLNYNWRKGDKIVEGTAFSFDLTESGDYFVEAIQNGCSSVSNTISVVIEPQANAIINAVGEETFCEGGSIKLFADRTKNYDYVWMKDDEVLPETSYSINASESGDYKAIVSLGNCSKVSNVITINVLDPMDPACTIGIQQLKLGYSVYPNPFKGSFNLELDKKQYKHGKVEIFNSMGTLVFNETIQNMSEKTQLEFDDKGLFIIKISSENFNHIIRLVGE